MKSFLLVALLAVLAVNGQTCDNILASYESKSLGFANFKVILSNSFPGDVEISTNSGNTIKIEVVGALGSKFPIQYSEDDGQIILSVAGSDSSGASQSFTPSSILIRVLALFLFYQVPDKRNKYLLGILMIALIFVPSSPVLSQMNDVACPVDIRISIPEAHRDTVVIDTDNVQGETLCSRGAYMNGQCLGWGSQYTLVYTDSSNPSVCSQIVTQTSYRVSSDEKTIVFTNNGKEDKYNLTQVYSENSGREGFTIQIPQGGSIPDSQYTGAVNITLWLRGRLFGAVPISITTDNQETCHFAFRCDSGSCLDATQPTSYCGQQDYLDPTPEYCSNRTTSFQPYCPAIRCSIWCTENQSNPFAPTCDVCTNQSSRCSADGVCFCTESGMISGSNRLIGFNSNYSIMVIAIIIAMMMGQYFLEIV